MKTLAERLTAFRESTGLNKNAFAKRLSIDQGLYGKYEAGTSKPSYEGLEKVASIYPTLNMRWLFSGEGSMYHGPALTATVAKTGDETDSDSLLERIEQLEQDLERERAYSEKLYEQNKQLRGVGRQLGKLPSSADTAAEAVPHRSIMWVEREAA